MDHYRWIWWWDAGFCVSASIHLYFRAPNKAARPDNEIDVLLPAWLNSHPLTHNWCAARCEYINTMHDTKSHSRSHQKKQPAVEMNSPLTATFSPICVGNQTFALTFAINLFIKCSTLIFTTPVDKFIAADFIFTSQIGWLCKYFPSANIANIGIAAIVVSVRSKFHDQRRVKIHFQYVSNFNSASRRCCYSGGRKITIIASDRRWNPLKVSRDSAASPHRAHIVCVDSSTAL